eukprot:6700990-Prymnesium_polylepis.1
MGGQRGRVIPSPKTRPRPEGPAARGSQTNQGGYTTYHVLSASRPCQARGFILGGSPAAPAGESRTDL